MLDVNNGIVVGDAGQIQIWDGLSWVIESSPVTSDLNEVIYVNADDIWSVGSGGVIIQKGIFYQDSGTFESRIIDSGSALSNWATASWEEVLPAGSDITIQVRAGETATPDPTWSVWGSFLTNSNGSSVLSTVGQYVQYRVNFTRGFNPKVTSEFHDIAITYNEPTIENINDISIVSSDNYWVVGDGGFIANYNGFSLIGVVSPVSEVLNSIDMVSANEGWAVGESGKILYYDGVSWVEFVDTGVMNWMSVKMINSTNGWLVGGNGLIYNYDGASWALYSDEGTMTWNDLDVVSPVFGLVVGDGGQIYQFDGAVWQSMSSPVSLVLNAVDGLSSTNAWIGGSDGTILNYDLYHYPEGTFLSQVFDGAEVDPGWDVVYWQESLPVDSDITLSTRTGATSVPDLSWTDWSPEMTNEILSQVPASQNDRYLQYRATLAMNSATSTPELDYVTITYLGATSFQLNDISAIDENDSWAVGNTGKIAHYNGVGWSLFVELGGGNLNTIDMVDANDGWAAGQAGEIYHYNGSVWSLFQDTGGDTWYAIDMVNSSSGWMTGNSGKIWFYNGVTWALYDDLGNRDIYDIDMISLTEGWAVGDHGEIYYYDGVLWTLFDDIGTTDLYGVHMISANNGWIVGASGKIYRYDGVSWNLVSSPTGQNLNDVYAFDASDSLVVGNNGVILHWDGISWTSVDNPNADDLYSVDMSSILAGWVVGFKGVVSLFRESADIVPPLGVLVSSAYQMGTSTYPIEVIEWDQEIPEDCSPISACTIKFEIRVATDNGGGPGAWSSWYGENGPGTYFENGRGGLISQDLNWNSWMQYRMTMTSDELVTPILYEVRINYKD